MYEDSEGKWRWRLRHDNGNIIADSSEGYSSKQKAKQGLASVQTNTTGAPIVEPE
nr:HVO_2922 family protein [Halalkaliarchaeum desulfuricum]